MPAPNELVGLGHAVLHHGLDLGLDVLVEVDFVRHALHVRGEAQRVREGAVDQDEPDDGRVVERVVGCDARHLEGYQAAQGPACARMPECQQNTLFCDSNSPSREQMAKGGGGWRTSEQDGPSLGYGLDQRQILVGHLVQSSFPLLARLAARVSDAVDGAVERFEQEVVEDGAAAIMDEEERCPPRAGRGCVDEDGIGSSHHYEERSESKDK